MNNFGKFITPEEAQKLGDKRSLEELKKAYNQWVGKDIFKYHDAFWQMDTKPTSTPADTVVGRITQCILNEADKAIDWIGEIYDRDIAYKIYTRLIKQISVGFMNDVTMMDGLAHKVNLQPQEATLVYRGKDPQASVEIKEINY